MKKQLRKKLCCLLCFMICLSTWCGVDYSNAGAEEISYNTVFVTGDLNGDKQILLEDAQLALQAALKIITLEPDVLKSADLFGDGMVTLEDAQNILLVALKIKSMDDILGTTTIQPTDVPIQTPTASPVIESSTHLQQIQ